MTATNKSTAAQSIRDAHLSAIVLERGAAARALYPAMTTVPTRATDELPLGPGSLSAYLPWTPPAN